MVQQTDVKDAEFIARTGTQTIAKELGQSDCYVGNTVSNNEALIFFSSVFQ